MAISRLLKLQATNLLAHYSSIASEPIPPHIKLSNLYLVSLPCIQTDPPPSLDYHCKSMSSYLSEMLARGIQCRTDAESGTQALQDCREVQDMFNLHCIPYRGSARRGRTGLIMTGKCTGDRNVCRMGWMCCRRGERFYWNRAQLFAIWGPVSWELLQALHWSYLQDGVVHLGQHHYAEILQGRYLWVAFTVWRKHCWVQGAQQAWLWLDRNQLLWQVQ